MRKWVLINLALAGLAQLLPAQTPQFVISTLAGGPSAILPTAALTTAIGSPEGVATDRAGNVYFTSLTPDSPTYYHGRYGVFKLDRNGVLTRIAGNTGEGFSGDGGPAVNATFRLSNFEDEPGLPGIVVDDGGGVYIADSGNNRVRLVSPDGIISTIAGNGTPGNSDGALAPFAQVDHPSSLTNYANNLYIYIESRGSIRRLTPGGVIETVASAAPGSAIATDFPGDNLYIVGGGSVRKLAPNGEITTIFSEDGMAIAVDQAGNVYLAQRGRVREITPTGLITTIAGNGSCGYSGDGGPAISAQVCANGVAVDRNGNLYLAEAQSRRIRRISPDGIISTVAGNGDCCISGDGGPAIYGQFNLAPWGGGMSVDRGGNVYIADAANQRVRRISQSGILTTVAGNSISNGYSGDGGPAIAAQLNYPEGVAVDSQGNLYIADTGNERIRKVSPDGVIHTVAKAGGRALAIDQNDNLYFADVAGVHKLSPSGAISTVTVTPLNQPFAAAADRVGNLYFAEIGGKNYRVRKITADGIVTTVAGAVSSGYSGDDGPAVNAQLNGPAGLAVDDKGNLYIADSFNSRIRVVSPDGIITTVAGTGGSGNSGDGGPATAAQLGSLSGLGIDRAGNLYAADQYYNAIRLLQPITLSPVVSAVVNAASNLPGAIAPGEMIVVSGYGLGPAQFVSSAPGGDYPAQLVGSSVLVNGVPAPMIYTSATQVAAVVPDAISSAVAQIGVSYQGQTSFPFATPVVPVAPAIFTADSTGRGNAVTVNQGGLINAPVNWGDSITLFVTGAGGATSGSVVFLPDSALQSSVPIAAGDIDNAAGVTRIRLTIPFGLICDVPIRIQLGSASSQPGVTLAMGICI